MTRAVVSAAAFSAIVASVAITASGLTAAPEPADLQVSVLPSRPDVYVNRRLVYTVVVKNVGGSDASGVGVNLGFSSGVDVDTASSARAACVAADPVDCSIDTLERNRSAKIRIALRPNASGPLVAHASAGLGEPELEPAQSNNDASVSTSVRPGKIGPPKLAVPRKPTGSAGSAAFAAVGEVSVSEPGTLTWRLKNTKTGATLVLLGGTVINGHTYPSSSTVIASGIAGGGNVPVTLRFNLVPGGAYAVVVRATDLEGQTAELTVPVRVTP